MATCTTEYFAGQGKVYVASRAKGGAINGGWVELGDTEKLEVTTKQNYQDIVSCRNGKRSPNCRLYSGPSQDFSCANILRD